MVVRATLVGGESDKNDCCLRCGGAASCTIMNVVHA